VVAADFLVLVETEDGKCVYLGRGNPRCHIYAHRPDVCRAMGIDPRMPCPFVNTDGIPRTKEETKVIEEAIEQKYRNFMDRINARREMRECVQEKTETRN
jgi:Fe-S-cluster containining protein